MLALNQPNPLANFANDKPEQSRYLGTCCARNEYASRRSVGNPLPGLGGRQIADLGKDLAALAITQRGDQPIRLEGEDRAVMPYDERHMVRFVRENGLWKIEDPD